MNSNMLSLFAELEPLCHANYSLIIYIYRRGSVWNSPFDL